MSQTQNHPFDTIESITRSDESEFPQPPSNDPSNESHIPKSDQPNEPDPFQTGQQTSVSSLIGEDEFKWKDTTYKLGPVILKIEAMFEQRCDKLEIQGIERRRNDVKPQTYAILIDRYLLGLGMSKWAWKGLPCLQARNEIEGKKDLYYFVLWWYNRPNLEHTSTHHTFTPISRGMLEDIWDNPVKWDELERKIIKLSDPNRLGLIPQAG